MSRNNIQSEIYIHNQSHTFAEISVGIVYLEIFQTPHFLGVHQVFSNGLSGSTWISFCWYSSYFHYSSGLLFCVCLCLFPSQPCYWMSLVSISFLAFPFHFSRLFSISDKWYSSFLTCLSIDLLARLLFRTIGPIFVKVR